MKNGVAVGRQHPDIKCNAPASHSTPEKSCATSDKPERKQTALGAKQKAESNPEASAASRVQSPDRW